MSALPWIWLRFETYLPSNMRLRVRHPKGTITLDSIQPDDTVLALREQIANTIGEHFARIQGHDNLRLGNILQSKLILSLTISCRRISSETFQRRYSNSWSRRNKKRRCLECYSCIRADKHSCYCHRDNCNNAEVAEKSGWWWNSDCSRRCTCIAGKTQTMQYRVATRYADASFTTVLRLWKTTIHACSVLSASRFFARRDKINPLLTFSV